mmetsp:Transcript_22178/g.66592  ORF Transcript_22178/g.66592 Transcript_22178/m.66592 type:complete len:139 (-) Transcript_22178:31-447(-)
MLSSLSCVDRARSVSSIRSTNLPCCAWRAINQLYSAVLAPPTCSDPVGDGAKRIRGFPALFAILLALSKTVLVASGRVAIFKREGMYDGARQASVVDRPISKYVCAMSKYFAPGVGRMSPRIARKELKVRNYTQLDSS